MRIRRVVAFVGHAVLSLLCYFVSTPAQAQEACGLQDANFDTIFAYGFDPPVTGGGLGPLASTVPPPVLGATPTVTITWPISGSVLPGGKVQIVGTVTGPVNTGVTIGGIRAYVRGGVFVTPELTFEPSLTNLTATATTMDGLSASANVAVTVSTVAADATLATGTPVGYAPLPAKFRLSMKSGPTLQSVFIDFDGNSVVDYTGTAVGDLPVFTYPTPGAYTATATLTFSDHVPVTATYRVIVLSLPEQRTAICATYAHLRSRLLAQDAAGAGFALMGGLKTRLMPLFIALGARMPGVAANLGILADGLIGLDSADIIAVRDLTDEVRGYPVHFARDAKGVWRVDSM